MTLTIGSLCSGYGGLDMAVTDVLDAEVAWHAETDPAASKVLAHHWDVPNHGDITAIDWTSVEPVDVLTAGFPCQDVSLAGQRRGLREGTRSGLWRHVARAISDLQPDMVVIENVPGLLSQSADGDVEPCPWCLGDTDGEHVLRALGAVLADLASLGFDAEWLSLAAAAVGAPHRRNRVFILAWPAADPPRIRQRKPPNETLALTGGWHARPQPRRRSVLAPPPRLGLLPTPRVSDANGVGGHGTGGPDLRTAVTLLPTPDATHGRKTTRTGPLLAGAVELLPTPKASDGAKGGPNQRGNSGDLALPSAVQPERWGRYAPAIAQWEHVLGWPAPAPTEPTGRNGNHQLSPRYVEWHMGLPDGHVTDVPGLTRNQQLRVLGGGVVPLQGSAALRILLDRAGTP